MSSTVRYSIHGQICNALIHFGRDKQAFIKDQISTDCLLVSTELRNFSRIRLLS